MTKREAATKRRFTDVFARRGVQMTGSDEVNESCDEPEESPDED